MERSVSHPRTDFSNTEMNLIGYLILIPLLVILLPLLPVGVLIWIGSKLKAS